MVMEPIISVDMSRNLEICLSVLQQLQIRMIFNILKIFLISKLLAFITCLHSCTFWGKHHWPRCADMCLIKCRFVAQYHIKIYIHSIFITSLGVGSSLPVTDILGAEIPSAKAEGRNLEWATMEAPQWGFCKLLQTPLIHRLASIKCPHRDILRDPTKLKFH